MHHILSKPITADQSEWSGPKICRFAEDTEFSKESMYVMSATAGG